MKKTSFLFVGLFAMGSLFTLAACGDDETSTSSGTTNGTAGGGMGGEGGGMGGAGGMGGSGGMGGGSATACDTYCTSIMAACTDANKQYADVAGCMGACAAMPEGKAGDMSGNTVQCRIYHAGAAAMAADMHCVHAGPGGADFCGSNCESFCAIATDVCPTEHPDATACMNECMNINDMEKYDASDAAGDTLACRLYHLTVASSSTANKATHCPHTVAMNNPVCKAP